MTPIVGARFITRMVWPESGVAEAMTLQALRDGLGRSGGDTAWLLVLPHACPLLDDLCDCLEASCRERAALYAALPRRRAFLAGRLLVRAIVGGPVTIATTGKPFVDGACGFNLSHAANCTALGLVQTGPVGADVESFVRLQTPRALIDVIAHPAEAALLHAAPEAALAALFLRCWTRKEALLKAIGCGLREEPARFDTRLHEPSPVVETALGCWRLHDVLLPALGAIAALAVSPRVRQLYLGSPHPLECPRRQYAPARTVSNSSPGAGPFP